MHDDLASTSRARRSPLALLMALLAAVCCLVPVAATASAAAEAGRAPVEVGGLFAESLVARRPVVHPARRRRRPLRRFERGARVFDPMWRRVGSRAPGRPRRPARELPPPPSPTVLPAARRAPPAP